MANKGKRVAVLKGGWSPEREVSLVSGAAAAAALRDAGYDAIEIDVDKNIAAVLAETAPDVVFNALHGQWGEDGCVQGMLEVMGLAYTHSGVLASSLAMDKQKAKAVMELAGVPAPMGKIIPREEAARGDALVRPYVVKPNNQGSSVGVFIFREGENKGAEALRGDSWDLGETVLVEQFIPGRELTVTVMGERTLGVTEIVAATEFYDYEAKYAEGGSRHILPAPIPADVAARAEALALKAHQALGCRGVTRADFRYHEEASGETLYCLEVNTQPGLTPTSLSPEQAAHLGITFPEFCAWMVEDASCQR